MPLVDFNRCTTHHYACPCREEQFAIIEAENLHCRSEAEKLSAACAELGKSNRSLRNELAELGYRLQQQAKTIYELRRTEKGRLLAGLESIVDICDNVADQDCDALVIRHIAEETLEGVTP